MKPIGTFVSTNWGRVTVLRGHYGTANGPLAIALETDEGEPLATLSVNLYKPDCSHDSRDLPANCFYVKTWSENEELAKEAQASGLFVCRDDLGVGRSGFVTAPVWQIKEQS